MPTPAIPDDLITWLRAQLDADNRLACALGGEGWNAHEPAQGMRRVTVDYSTECVVACTLSARGEHIARWDPARVLAEVDAKRRILDLMMPGRPVYPGAYGQAYRDVLRLLALPYADRPGYREEWKP